MRLADFIRNHSDEIIRDWEENARRCPTTPGLSEQEVRDHIATMLKVILSYLDTPDDKEKENPDTDASHATAAKQHGEQRFNKGFDTLEMTAEFRMLRADVVRLWLNKLGRNLDEVEDVVRFDAAVDKMQAESLSRYVDRERRARSLFLGTLIHDIRNPLNAIVQSAQLLEMIGSPDARKIRLFAQIHRSSARINELVSRLIDTVRLRLGKPIPLSRTPLDFVETVRQSLDELRAAFPGRLIEFDAPARIVGEWDKGRIDQVISNLVGNALQHGDKTAPVTLTLREEGEEVSLSVHNAGKPIPSDELSQIFDPMARGLGKIQDDPTKMSIGLGLFITRQSVIAHGGTIAVASDAGSGTTFTIKMPRYRPEGEEQEEE